jgi:hypothetical protein
VAGSGGLVLDEVLQRAASTQSYKVLSKDFPERDAPAGRKWVGTGNHQHEPVGGKGQQLQAAWIDGV